MNISPVSSSPPPPALQASQAAKVPPPRRDRDGDYDNNAAETKRADAAESGRNGQLLNIKA